MDKLGKIVSAIGVGVLLVGASAALTHKIDSNSTQDKIDALTSEFKSQLDAKPKEVIKTVEVKVPVETVKEVPVDNGNLANVMSFVKDNFDEDISVDYIIFETDAKIEAEAYISDNFKSMLKDNDFFDDGALLGDYRTSEVSISKVYDAVVSDRDYDNKDAVLEYKIKAKAKKEGEDSVTFYFDMTIPFEKGKLVSDDVELVAE